MRVRLPAEPTVLVGVRMRMFVLMIEPCGDLRHDAAATDGGMTSYPLFG